MTTKLLYQDDAYAESCATVIAGKDEAGRVILDSTVFYPTGGGQPGDRGWLETANGSSIDVVTTRKGAEPGSVLHELQDPETAPEVGTEVTARIDWALRHRHMRMHTALHLLSVAVPFPVTGGQIGDGSGRLDFDIDRALPPADDITSHLMELVDADHLVTATWISDEELDARPDLVKTMAVAPPRGTGKVRLIRIGDIDLQPCGGTHVRSTSEIGAIAVEKIQSKGARNKRIRIAFQDAPTG
ncbi:MAG: alanyl-tRNA editing protein [Pseudomonadota bacterium]